MTQEAKNMWVIVEHRGGKVASVTLEALGVARKLADASAQEVWAVLLADDAGSLDTGRLIACGADVVLVAEHPKLDTYRDDPYTDVVTHLVEAYGPAVIIIGATSSGKSLAPRLAARLRTGLASECVDLEWDREKGLVAVRPMYGGNVLATVETPKARPQLATLRMKSAPRPEPDTSRTGRVEKADLSGLDITDRVKLLEAVETGVGEVKLEEADIVVSGGRGVGKPENFALIKALADACRGAMGASRAAVDAGWVPYAHQVGQTGKTVSPKVYIACGISGAIQHLAGMKSSDIIVAINKNPDAPIFKVATYGIVGDLFEIVPLLTEEIKKETA